MEKKVKFFQSIRLKIILIYILLLLIAIQVIGAYFANNLETKLRENFIESINDRVELLTYQLQQTFTKTRTEEDRSLQHDIQSVLADYDIDDITELQVIDAQGRIIGTTNQFNKEVVGKLTNRPEIERMLIFGTEYKPAIVYNPRIGHRTLVKMVPIFVNQKKEVVGAIYLEASIEGVYDQLEEISSIFLNGTLLAISISALLGILVARTITKPISAMRKQAHVMAGGDFSKKVDVYGMDEIGQLAMSFNHLNDKLKQSYATTEGERRKLTSVLSNMNDGVIATDHNGSIILMNDPAKKIIGKTFEQIKGKSLLELLGITDQIETIEDVPQTGSIIIDYSDEEQHLLVKASFSVIQDENEMMNGFITVLSDVTEEEKIERERREFVANVSHELRTPLTSMRSYLEALADGETWKDPEIAPKFLAVTQTETERMIRLVNDLLQLSKMDNKDYYLHKEKVDFTKFFHHVIDRFEMNKYEHLQFKRDLLAQTLWVWIDKDKIIQVLDNVISNAVKYSPEGGVIKLGTKVKNKMLLITVSDQGVGIPIDQIDKIFNRFYRVDKARSRKLGGTGLGLAIAKEMIEAHNGEIWAESEEGKGTTIFLTLPLMHKKRGDVS
ncbi:two-component system sensor histidine kinase VicK [Salirhabdus euzebyi]|uniref:histidine kinase n=1 Tax=Salirhabdus euzebyi TaxID=394506 RepID=A0A841Q7B0_9BACI|nr:cell wall metabolism sensor histidine kinase WalK [Salirhabdus euzebyi]MBB6454449.1 two-component system sensor histidine kinase VicK [Salirhabdus euzebyi]